MQIPFGSGLGHFYSELGAEAVIRFVGESSVDSMHFSSTTTEATIRMIQTTSVDALFMIENSVPAVWLFVALSPDLSDPFNETGFETLLRFVSESSVDGRTMRDMDPVQAVLFTSEFSVEYVIQGDFEGEEVILMTFGGIELTLSHPRFIAYSSFIVDAQPYAGSTITAVTHLVQET